MSITFHHLYVHSPTVQLSVIESSSLIEGASEIRINLAAPNVSLCHQTFDQCLGRMHHLIRSFAEDNY
ncbi:hypothetical protein [Candidatus Nitrosacidococcus tergens]|uniref:hypothetical protein n=1 Tax=Candidatus Nitrosacidococcus tergens TaxID=553981 RepID=UPI0018D60E10|nr:hypothetical protein [Candidatus Nitrosacidococcus tergens]